MFNNNNNNNLIYIAPVCRMTSEALADSSSQYLCKPLQDTSSHLASNIFTYHQCLMLTDDEANGGTES